MKYRETVGMASVECEGTPQEIHALLLLIEEGSEKTSKAIKNILKEGESKARDEVSGSAINESVVEGLKNIEKALLSGQTIV